MKQFTLHQVRSQANVGGSPENYFSEEQLSRDMTVLKKQCYMFHYCLVTVALLALFVLEVVAREEMTGTFNIGSAYVLVGARFQIPGGEQEG